MEEGFGKEIKYFKDNLETFLKDDNLTDKYVAIYKQKVVGVGEDRVALMKKIYNELGYKPILFKKVTNKQSILRLRSPKLR